jgi:hypothetical protein
MKKRLTDEQIIGLLLEAEVGGMSIKVARNILRDDQYARIEEMLPGKATDVGVTAKDNRLFVEAVLWIARTGSPWRDLPASFSP